MKLNEIDLTINKATRESWGNPEITVDSTGIFAPMLGHSPVWVPSEEDLSATDWEIVDKTDKIA